MVVFSVLNSPCHATAMDAHAGPASLLLVFGPRNPDVGPFRINFYILRKNLAQFIASERSVQ